MATVDTAALRNQVERFQEVHDALVREVRKVIHDVPERPSLGIR